MDGRAISFGPYRLLAARRLLLEGDKPVRLGSRAFDILTALVERAGKVVSKEELIARAWPATHVEEANLKIQVSALRRALGDGQGGNRYVVNVVGRGYNFVAPIRAEERSRASPSPIVAPAALHNLPFATTRMIGREEIVTTLVTQLSHQRLVTVVGPGGIGKTTVALAVAERMIGGYEHGVWLVDLAPLRDPGLVPSAVATVLGLEIRIEDPLPDLVAALRDNRMLLMLDNCEHVIDATAGLAAAVLSGAPGVTILATSREPLGVRGERVHRLGPLGSPELSPTLTATEAAAFPAVQLFLERVTANVEDFALTDANALLVVAICRRLDGLPLAIEFAAPRVESLGVEGLAARLDDILPLLGMRRRSAAPRHRTMRAVVDWSYGLLSADEQLFLRALGIFAGGFSVEAAAAVATDAPRTSIDAIDLLADLVAKSLVVADVSAAKPRFRLLDTIRAYAIELLDSSGERERRARRHAEYYQNLLERAETKSERLPAPEWLDDYGRQIDNLRAALDWAVSPGGDAATAVALTAAAVPVWMRLSLMEECRGHVERALATFDAGLIHDARREMKLHAARAVLFPYIGSDISEIGVASAKALQLAEMIGDFEYQLRSLWSQWYFHSANGRYRIALARAQRFSTIAANQADATDQLVGEILVGVSLHYLGDQAGARSHIGHALEHAPLQRSHVVRFLVDQRVFAGAYLSRILWLQGFPEQAMRTAERCIDDALAANHAVSLCNALALGACLIALLVGDLAKAERYIGILLDHSKKSALPVSRAYGRSYDGVLAIERGDLDSGLRLLRAGLDDFEKMTPSARYPTRPAFPAKLASALAGVGRFADGLAAIDEVLAWTADTEADWFIAELLRVKGELLLLQGAPEAAATAEDHFWQALAWARRHGALSWELRAATSLARLRRDLGRPADATACLQPIYDRFTEGFGTTDLITAKQLLDQLGTPDHD
jgi:predicted ATPase/DNA-binding winged helix-turn-helix (wHTH) protein